ncbi:amidohydrolase family protein [Ruegeria atlantica]|uniref:amidohydrolase family protein n=1 Tax=Ruegeria atlantica TaxID=81569 RepID=UPI00147A2086|nr:amidohydrolase family protein [Ruegeria atlantica]
MPGCYGQGEGRNISPEGLPSVPVDIHNHIFNATDVPIPGFVEQVLLRDPETPVPGGPSVARSLVRLVVDIVLAARGTPTASEELIETANLQRLPVRDGGDMLIQDRRSVEAGLVALESRVDSAGRARQGAFITDGTLPVPTGDEILFSLLATESDIPVNPVGRAGNIRDSARAGNQARQIADAIYADEAFRDDPSFKSLSERKNPDLSLIQTLMWAGLLTRSRVDILGELIRLYAHQTAKADTNDPLGSNGIKVFSPSLVDFTYWLQDGQVRDADRSGRDITDQIDLLSRMALLERGALILPFAPFCPLRAAFYRKNGNPNWLRTIQKSVDFQGFAGIKLYPPMGFLPLGNTRFDAPGSGKPRALQELGITGQEIDNELRALYDWCAAEDVPIKTHGNNSLGADACTGQNASAANWKPVLETKEWSGLRLNIAHFGGFDEERFRTAPGCPIQTQAYEWQAAALIAKYNNVYVDLGYWTDVTGSNRDQSQEIIDLLDNLLNRSENLKSRLMYGSDWTMLGRENQHAGYYNDVRKALKESVLEKSDQIAILGANALRYLGLDRRGKQFKRLTGYFKAAPQFNTIITLIRPSSNLLAVARDALNQR